MPTNDLSEPATKKSREDLNQNLETDDSDEALEMCDTNANDSFPHGSNSESSQQRARVPGQEEGVGDGSQSDESIDQTGDSIWGGDGEHLVGDQHEDSVRE